MFNYGLLAWCLHTGVHRDFSRPLKLERFESTRFYVLPG